MTAAFRLLITAFLAMVFSVLFPAHLHAQRVAVVASDTDVNIGDVHAKLNAAGLTDVTAINISTQSGVTPTLETLQQFDAILTWSNLSFASAATFGDRLADYVDGGGAVVEAALVFHPVAAVRIGGRWASQGYDIFSVGALNMGSGLTLVAAKPQHPILNGVASFNGGDLSFHHALNVQGCADVVATWSNQRPLIATRPGPHGGNIVALNFYPVSSDVNNGLWLSSTDGGMLLANALRFAAAGASAPPPSSSNGPAVALVAADDASRVTDVKCKLEQTALFSRVDVIDARVATPTLASLLDYAAVLTWANGSYGDAAALGTMLADFADQDRGVVQSVVNPASGTLLGGRWTTDGYRPFSAGGLVSGSQQSLVTALPGHVILNGVAQFDGGSSSAHATPVLPEAANAVVATWNLDGQPLVGAGRAPSGGRSVGLNLYPPSSDAAAGLWNSATDGARLMANALLFAANRFPSIDAGVNQSAEAGSQVGASFTLNGSASDLDGDALSFAWSGAGTATIASITVDVPPPPAPQKSHTVTMTLTVSDGKGGEVSDTVDLTVTDTTAPVLQNMPTGTLTANATSGAGADVTYGPVTALDAVDGNVPVNCSHAGTFPVGDTLVTCSATDSRINQVVETFIVRVVGASAPGRMLGAGFVRANGRRHAFKFSVRETEQGEQGEFEMKVDRHQFVATSIESMAFSGNSVLFRGTGHHNGVAGHTYEVLAVDNGEPGHQDRVRITITGPSGANVVEGELNGGNVQLLPTK